MKPVKRIITLLFAIMLLVSVNGCFANNSSSNTPVSTTFVREETLEKTTKTEETSTETSTTAETTTTASVYIVNTNQDNLMLRESPSLDGKVLAGIPKGTKLIVDKESNGWSQVSYNGKIGWVKSDYLLEESQYRETPIDKTAEIQSRIRVFYVRTNTTTADYVEPVVFWRNESNKTIKYIHFEFTPYNAVDDVVQCNIRHYSTHTCSITGPIPKTEQGSYYHVSDLDSEYGECWLLVGNDDDGRVFAYSPGPYWDNFYLSDDDINKTALVYEWENVWYNTDIRRITLDSIIIEYMDGERFYIDNSNINKVFW